VIVRPFAFAAGVTIVLWLPPVIQELTSANGNLTALAQFFSRAGSPHDLGQGFDHAMQQATLMLRAMFESVSVRNPSQAGVAVGAVVTVLALVLGIVVAVRAKAWDALVLLALVAVELACAIYSVTRIVGAIEY